MINSNDGAISQCMSDNIKGKFSFLASQLPEMSVQQLNGLQYVDCGRQSDTFNTVFGMLSCKKEIEIITRYFRKNNRPAAWWFPSSPSEYREELYQAGWVHEENEVGMHLDLTAPLKVPEPVLSRIEYCDSMERFNDFGRVLSAIFEPGNTTEADNIKAIYQLTGEHSAELPNCLVQLVGYAGDEPVSTATVYLKDNVAGIFDIATPEAWRNRGYGSEMFYRALQVAQQRGAATCVLQASPDGLNIYKRFGFISSGNFEVWNLSHHT